MGTPALNRRLAAAALAIGAAVLVLVLLESPAEAVWFAPFGLSPAVPLVLRRWPLAFRLSAGLLGFGIGFVALFTGALFLVLAALLILAAVVPGGRLSRAQRIACAGVFAVLVLLLVF